VWDWEVKATAASTWQQRLNRALRLVTKCNQLLVHADDESRFLRAICQLIVTDGGYLAASVRDPSVERSERDPPDPDHVGARPKPGSEGTSKVPAIRPERTPELVSERAMQSPAGSYIDIPLTSGDRDDSGLPKFPHLKDGVHTAAVDQLRRFA
jgi:hypothetical protein